MQVTISKIFWLITPELNAVSPHTVCYPHIQLSSKYIWSWSWFHIRAIVLYIIQGNGNGTVNFLTLLQDFNDYIRYKCAENSSCQLQLISSVSGEVNRVQNAFGSMILWFYNTSQQADWQTPHSRNNFTYCFSQRGQLQGRIEFPEAAKCLCSADSF